MKVFDCICEFGHQFEGWFDSAEGLDRQIQEHLVNCPHCNSTNIRRMPSAPHVQGFRDQEKARASQAQEECLEGALRRELMQQARALIKDSEDVGDAFCEQARAQKAGLAPQKKIHGRCTLADAQDLLEEGIGVVPLPKGVVHSNN